MTPPQRCLRTGHALLARHAVAGAVPALELRVWLAELEAALDAEPARELAELGTRTDLDHPTPAEPRPR